MGKPGAQAPGFSFGAYFILTYFSLPAWIIADTAIFLMIDGNWQRRFVCFVGDVACVCDACAVH